MNKDDEQILVVKSDTLFKDPPRLDEAGGKWQGLKTDNLDYYVDLIKTNSEFKRRGDMEDDPSYQQIIPYILFNYEDKYFLYNYLAKAGEQRLINDPILGVGGHINIEDIKGESDVLEAGRDREWDEEVAFNGKLDKKLVGILNDDRRPVEAVHLGMIYIFTGDNPHLTIKESDKMAGELVDLKELKEKLKGTEGWAPLIYNEYLSKVI